MSDKPIIVKRAYVVVEEYAVFADTEKEAIDELVGWGGDPYSITEINTEEYNGYYYVEKERAKVNER